MSCKIKFVSAGLNAAGLLAAAAFATPMQRKSIFTNRNIAGVLS